MKIRPVRCRRRTEIASRIPQGTMQPGSFRKERSRSGQGATPREESRRPSGYSANLLSRVKRRPAKRGSPKSEDTVAGSVKGGI